ncbi:MAG: hypothetical protein J6Y62_01710 [Clostridia bacterium]|nr:hypothetical protein [Clostridia bacterium]
MTEEELKTKMSETLEGMAGAYSDSTRKEVMDGETVFLFEMSRRRDGRRIRVFRNGQIVGKLEGDLSAPDGKPFSPENLQALIGETLSTDRLWREEAEEAVKLGMSVEKELKFKIPLLDGGVFEMRRKYGWMNKVEVSSELIGDSYDHSVEYVGPRSVFRALKLAVRDYPSLLPLLPEEIRMRLVEEKD